MKFNLRERVDVIGGPHKGRRGEVVSWVLAWYTVRFTDRYLGDGWNVEHHMIHGKHLRRVLPERFSLMEV